MKSIYMIFSKLRTLFATEKLFFVVFCIGILTCNIMFTYMYGLVMQLNERDGVADVYLYYVQGERMDIDDMEKSCYKYSCECDYYVVMDSANCSVGDESVMLPWDEYLIRAKKDPSAFYAETGSTKDLLKPATVVVPTELQISIGDTIRLNGVDLLVVGTSVVPSFIVSADTLTQNGLVPDVYALDLAAKDIRRAGDDFSRTISPGYYVEQMSGSGMDGQTLSTLGTVVVIYLLCMLSFMYLMTFLYDSSAYEFNVYEILGATRRRVLAVLGGVMFLLLAVISLVSQFLYAVFYESFFSKLNLFGGFSYSFGDYVAVFFLTLVLVFVFVFAYICVRTSRSTIQNSRKFIS